MLKINVPAVKKGIGCVDSFTLIELLIVIGILAILVAAVVVVLNPAQLLAQARDGQRLQDMSSIQSALNTIASLDQTISMGATNTVFISLPDATSSCASWSLPTLPSGWSYHCVDTSTLEDTDGTGWIPVSFNTTGVVSLARLPIDPVNDTSYYYAYIPGGSFELTARFESLKYQSQAANDGGTYGDVYEAGSSLTLLPAYIYVGSLPSGLVAYWPLNESSGTTASDQGGSGMNGTWSSPQFGAGHNWPSAASFSGSNSINLNAANPVTSNAFTITGWINVASGVAGNNYMITKGGDGSCGPSYGIDAYGPGSGGYQISFMTAESTFQKYWLGTNASYPYGQWEFVGVTMSSSDVGSKLIYMNGALASSTVYSGSEGSTSEPITASSLGLYIGQQACGSAYNFRGLINDIRIYNRALSASEIDQIYLSGH